MTTKCGHMLWHRKTAMLLMNPFSITHVSEYSQRNAKLHTVKIGKWNNIDGTIGFVALKANIKHTEKSTGKWNMWKILYKCIYLRCWGLRAHKFWRMNVLNCNILLIYFCFSAGQITVNILKLCDRTHTCALRMPLHTSICIIDCMRCGYTWITEVQFRSKKIHII